VHRNVTKKYQHSRTEHDAAVYKQYTASRRQATLARIYILRLTDHCLLLTSWLAAALNKANWRSHARVCASIYYDTTTL